MWATASRNVQVTVPPSPTLSFAGVKVKFWTDTATFLAAASPAPWDGRGCDGTASAAAAAAAGATSRSERGVMTFPFL